MNIKTEHNIDNIVFFLKDEIITEGLVKQIQINITNINDISYPYTNNGINIQYAVKFEDELLPITEGRLYGNRKDIEDFVVKKALEKAYGDKN